MGSIDTQKIYVHQLQPGMYVSGLDRPWLETPFHLQGFMVQTSSDIQKLSLFCDYVYIDVEKSITHLDITAQTAANAPSKKRKMGFAAKAFNDELSTRRITEYTEQVPVTGEIKSANHAYQNIKQEFDRLTSQINSGKALNINKLNQVVDPLVDSVIRNPGASIWLARLKSKDSYTYKHCLSVAVWCSVIGRQIGLPKRELALLATGGMLLDIGKLKLPPALLNKTEQLSEREFSLLKKHVELSLKMLSESSRPAPPAIIDMIAHHHERFNGSGYPNNLQGTDIPLYARIAAIADCYDAITSPRVYAAPIPHSVALKKMYDWRGYDFQPELVEAFIQATGIYPTGTMVELTSGEVGVVIKENPSKRLRPHVLLILDKNKQQLADFKELNLASLPTDEQQEKLEISQTLEPGSYDLDPETLYI